MIIESPWRHEVIDNFLEQDDFKFLSNVGIDNPNDTDIKISKNQIWQGGRIKGDLPHEFLKRFEQRYFQKCINVLHQHATGKVSSVDYMELNVVVVGKDYVFPVHSDTPNKLLSCVVYLTPEDSIGTIMYESIDGDEVDRCEWKQNRCLIFSRTNKTYHNYKSDGKDKRRTLVLNLRSSKK